MNILKKPILPMGLLSVLRAIPSMAQITNRVTFDALSAFLRGNAKMPAGSYTVSQPDMDANLLLIEDTNGSPSAFVAYEVVSSGTPHAQSDVTFNKYGKVDFLSAIWVQGQKSEMQILPSKAEQNAIFFSIAMFLVLTAASFAQHVKTDYHQESRQGSPEDVRTFLPRRRKGNAECGWRQLGHSC